ncbi:glucose-6-phosphate isomerase, partial [Acinetobacter baumannii]|nr:glucose-6-phosphate isomerase [Acinetobacter baumannii]
HIKELFALEPERFQNYSVKFDQLFFDYSKQRITKNILEQLVALANNKQLTQWINRLFSQDKINCTEQRAAMHLSLI